MRPGRMRNGESWSAARRGALVSVGWHDGTRASFCWLADAVVPAEERSMRRKAGYMHLHARDAGALGFPSDPS